MAATNSGETERLRSVSSARSRASAAILRPRATSSAGDGFDACVTSAYWNWGPTYVDAISSLLDGSWDPSDISWGPFTNQDDSVVGLSEISSIVPGAVRTAVSEAKIDIQAEPSAPFLGPLSDNQGVERLADEETMTDVALDRLCWYVDGVITSESGSDVAATVPGECQGDH